MQIPVLIEPVAGSGYRARGGEPFALTADGATPEEVLQKLREAIHTRLAAGAQVVVLEVPVANPWARFTGIFKEDDPLVQEWIQIMAENRRKAEEDPDVP